MSRSCLIRLCNRLRTDHGSTGNLLRNISSSSCLKDKNLEVKKEIKPAEKEQDDKGSLKNWIKMRTNKQGPQNLPSDSSHLDHIDRMILFRNSKDNDYNSICRAASFFDSDTKDYNHFNQVVEGFKDPKQSGFRVGQVEFIYGAMKRLKDYGVHKDVRAYNALLSVFPKGKMLPENPIQAGFLHYARQQFCAVDLLEEMEWNQVCPDQETVKLVLAIFGITSRVYEKMGGMIYWITKARYNDPFPLPNVLPENPKELAKISFRRMCVDTNTQISVYSTDGVPEAIDKTWIVSAMSPVQLNLINKIDGDPLFIDGPHIMWTKDHMTNYFVLRTAAPKQSPLEEEDFEDMRNLPLYAFGGLSKKEHIEAMESTHKCSEGTVLGLVATGTSSRDSLLSWVRILQHHIPKLKQLNIVFALKAPETGLDVVNNDNEDSSELRQEEEEVKKLVHK